MSVVVKLFLGFLLPISFVFSSPCFAGSEVTLEKMKWPASTKCLKCISIQYGRLSMKLPMADVGKIYVQDHAGQFFSIFPKDKGSAKWAIMLPMPENETLESFRKKGLVEGFGVSTNEEFMDLLGGDPGVNDALVNMRLIMGISGAEKYIKMSKGKLHAYWINKNEYDSVYFVMSGDGGDDAYLLYGKLDDGFIKNVMANMEISNRP